MEKRISNAASETGIFEARGGEPDVSVPEAQKPCAGNAAGTDGTFEKCGRQDGCASSNQNDAAGGTINAQQKRDSGETADPYAGVRGQEKQYTGASAQERPQMEEKTGGKPQYILLEKTKALYTLLHPLLDTFPNAAKFTLRARMEEALLDALKFQILQNYRQNDGERRETMLEVLANLNILSVLLQQAAIFKYVSFSQQETASGLLRELVAIATARYRNLGGGGL